MTSIQSRLKTIYDALLTVSDRTYHYERPSTVTVPYIVWAETAEARALSADGHKQEQAVTVYVELYTQTEFDPLVDSIQECLDTVCAWRLADVQYGDPTHDSTDTIHYTWECEIA